ncbi:MAG: Butyryl-CoA dehydrogenase [Bacteriovoracaceae bacterium]|nr:Butyryl-CoA dehydrogenase [Bacteriovoracaceae bacterium]
MNFALSQDQIEAREWARAFAKEVIAPSAFLHSREKIKPSLLEEISKKGFMTLLVPETLGGLALDAVSFALVMKEISKACGSVGVTVAVTNMIADVLVREGSSFQHQKYLADLVSGRSLTASFCLTENSAGSDAKALKTSAKKNISGYQISGEKIFVTNGAFSGFFLVMARTSDEAVSAFLVERGAPGLQLGKEEDKMGLTGSSTIRLSLENVQVKPEQLVGKEGDGFKIAMRALDGGRISVSAQALGIAEAALEAGIRYAKERQAFGKSLSDFQAIQWKLADSATSLSAAELLMLRAATLKSEKKDFTQEASQAKLFSTEAACKVCEEMIQIHGGYGYTKDYPVEKYFRDVRVTTLYEGTSEIQRLVIARNLLR